MNKLPKARTENIVVQELDNELLIYDLMSNRALCLNETTKLIWQACDGKKTAMEIGEGIGQTLKSTPNEEIVWLALDLLEKENLIENGEQFSNHFAGISRREVIKKVGFGTMIALPVIAAVVAPNSISAASCGTTLEFSPCSTNTNCSSCCCSIGGPGPMICVPSANQGLGQTCFANCQCASNSCTGTLGNLMCT